MSSTVESKPDPDHLQRTSQAGLDSDMVPDLATDQRRHMLTKPASLVALTGLLMLGVFALLRLDPHARNGSAATAATAAGPASLPWIAAAPGRVEPRTGEVRVGAPILGRVFEVLSKTNDEVNEGDLLVRLDDEDSGQDAFLESAARGGTARSFRGVLPK